MGGKEKNQRDVHFLCSSMFDIPAVRTFLIMCTAGKNIVEWYLLLVLHHSPTTVASARSPHNAQHPPSSQMKLMM